MWVFGQLPPPPRPSVDSLNPRQDLCSPLGWAVNANRKEQRAILAYVDLFGQKHFNGVFLRKEQEIET